ncbi:DNA polymerase III subunit delta [Thermoanaerobacterium sp. RBIITD]|uniref:DNA polymerase III subunit delta n=1 Tax=Thermoanaerobacterium sp. RBIITD TaxID=1550240 RepID=UPI000BBF4BA8|nr:DNA polymerase III subunit delta [Thermoanaerobacterium sp. RBIITD]SNX55224.1 DNA polymerase III, delta subunit [Thermoanaerobacterium sp. RBIITD]
MNYSDFVNMINKNILPVYVFYGEERFLVDEAVKKIKSKLLDGITDAMNLSIIDNADNNNIIDSLETLPFMSNHRLIIVKDDELLKKLDDLAIDKIIKYLEKKDITNCLVIVLNDKIDMRKKLFKTINKVGAIVNFDYLKHDDAVNYTGYFVRSFGKTIKKPVAEYIVKNCGVDLYRLLNEVKKLVSYSDNSEVTIENVKHLLSSNINESVFKLVNSIGLRQEKTAIYILNRMIESNENPIGILAMIVRQFRILIRAKYYLKQKIERRDLSSRLGIPYFSINDVIEQCKHFEESDIINAYNVCIKCDRELKSSYNGNLVLESLIRKLCN